MRYSLNTTIWSQEQNSAIQIELNDDSRAQLA